jgi:hypothetical protein
MTHDPTTDTASGERRSTTHVASDAGARNAKAEGTTARCRTTR